MQWRSPEWIQMFGLRTDNVLEYFSESPFYDRSSNNQVLKMQSQFNDNMQHNRGPADFYKELRNMRGVEFVVAISREPDLWVIRKQTRLSPQEVRPLATYFVIGENIYMAPSVYSVVTSRLLSTALSLNKALAKASSLPGFSPSQGYFYKNDNNSIPFNATTSGSNSSTTTTSTPATTSNRQSTAATGRMSAAATPLSTGPSNTPGSQSSNNATSGLPMTIAAERIAYYNIDRALSNSISNTTVFIDDPTPVSAAAGITAASNGSAGPGGASGAGQGLLASAQSALGGVNSSVATSALSASPSSTDLKAKAAMNNQVAAATSAKRRRKQQLR